MSFSYKCTMLKLLKKLSYKVYTKHKCLNYKIIIEQNIYNFNHTYVYFVSFLNTYIFICQHITWNHDIIFNNQKFVIYFITLNNFNFFAFEGYLLIIGFSIYIFNFIFNIRHFCVGNVLYVNRKFMPDFSCCVFQIIQQI